MRMTSKGQVTIPKHVRDSAGIKPGAELSVVFEDSVIKVMRRKRQDGTKPYEDWLKRVKGTATAAVSTDEILIATRGRKYDLNSR